MIILPVLADALEHLRVDSGYDDAKVQSCLDAAISAAGEFLDRGDLRFVAGSSDAFDGVNGDSVNHAILMICERLYDARSAGQGEILKPWSTEWMLLFPSRRVGV